MKANDRIMVKKERNMEFEGESERGRERVKESKGERERVSK